MINRFKNRVKLIFLLPLLVSCDGFLDQLPDSRVEINTPEQIEKLLVDGYSSQNYALLGELSSDNFIDNNSPSNTGVRYNLSAFDRLHDEIFAWEPGVSSQDSDSPSAIWSGAYHAIATANQALQQIALLEKEGRAQEVAYLKGEALLIRAYHHFILSNIFCQHYKNDLLSAKDSGVPYITEPETEVLVNYTRSSVTGNYKLIEADLLAGIQLVDDSKYSVPKYHFNQRAAYAFAARFYLYKRDYPKVIEYASLALGDNPAGILRDWNKDYPTYYSFADGWINASSPNNFLLISTYSTFNRIFGTRYGHNRDASDGTLLGTGPTWSSYNFNPCYNGRLYLRGAVDYGVFFPKCGEYFEYSDKIAGIGYAHIIKAEFTAEETLLARAEAYVFLNQFDAAVADLKTFDDARKNVNFEYKDLTEDLIRSFYVDSRTDFVKKFKTSSMAPEFVVSASQKPLLDCVLHFRRHETLFDGLRWFDIKRYGIELTHSIGISQVETLRWDDPRRAIQIPAEVISAGLTPNYRVGTQDESENIQLESYLIKFE